MIGEQFKLLLQFYFAPRRAASGVLDHGKLGFAVVAAIAVAIALTFVSEVAKLREITKIAQEMQMDQVAMVDPDGNVDMSAPGARERLLKAQAQFAQYTVAAQRVERRYFGSSWRALAVLAIVFVPACLVIAAAWAHLGSATTVLFRDYMPLLVNCLFAWTAAHLPVAALWFAGVLQSPEAMYYSQIAGSLLFLVLSAFCLQSVLGIDIPQALGVGVAGVAASFAGGFLFSMSSGLMYMFLTPWALYYAYQMFGRDVSALGGGLASRQNFKRQLENSTINPHDADAHYQLGLIYKQRRNIENAEQSFRRALEIDREDEMVLFELGKLLRETNRHEEARPLLEKGARINDKLANHEVWRELGAVALAGGQASEALGYLSKYVERREYDPEGLVLLGRALRAGDRQAEAKSAFERAILAVKSAPAFRKHELKRFEKMAEQELRSV